MNLDTSILSRIIEHIPIILYLKEADELRFVEFNRSAVEVMGMSRDDVIGRHSGDLFGVEAAKRFDREDRQVLAGEKVDLPEEVLSLRDGRVRTLQSRKVLIRDDRGNPAYILGISDDITERKQAEAAIREAKQAAEATNRAKSDFLANMSHEIRTPMNGIIGMTELALDTELTPEQREYLLLVKTSAGALLTIINDILDFSKIEAGKLDLDATEFRLRDCIGDALKSIAVKADSKGLELAAEVAPDVPDVIIGDPGRLRQVLLNLVGNAIKFTEVGEVVVQVTRMSLTAGVATIGFAVTDTGIGIAGDKLELVFQPFTQADSSTTRRFGGTGLGLTISSELVGRMGGTLTVASELGRGTTFSFDARFEVTEPTEQDAGAMPSLEGRAVLIVDDNSTNRRILEGSIRQFGMIPTVAASGAEALRLIEAHERPFALVLLDVNMPEMDGFMFVERLRRTTTPVETTILMLSSAGRRGDSARCRQLGIRAYLTKPLKRSELLEAIVATLAADPGQARRDQLITRHTLRADRAPLSVLLAEDNPVNQRLATRVLQKMGNAVTVAETGAAAVEAWQLAARGEKPFDVVLMDVQMPEMDGLEATRVIRNHEAALARRRTPIIAMTAHALRGDKERCLEAGMDGYLSKPLSINDLQEMLVGVSLQRPLEDVATPTSGQGDAETWNQQVAMAQVDGDPEILRDVVAALVDDLPRQRRIIAAAIESGEVARVAAAVHSLKGAVAAVSAQGAHRAAEALENATRTGDLDNCRAEHPALEREVDRLLADLQRFVGSSPPAAE